MKLIIAGSRDITLTCACRAVEGALEKTGWCHAITEVVSGASGNVDKIGEFWAELMELPIKRFPADWDKHGKAAGPIRNRAMAEYADALIAVWDGESKGTANMILEMHRQGKPVFVWRVNECVS